ncbi:glycosyltransferase [Candidatus Parcubacteria bacterium]|nr:glycosyltransferase [Candidatus Parcubacteria bacterium]
MDSSGLKVLMISSDRNILVPGSVVRGRMEEFGGLVEELHIVIFSLRTKGFESGQIASNVWVYPTSSRSKWFYIQDAFRIGGQIISKNNFLKSRSLLTVQDPFEAGLVGVWIKKKWHLPLEIQMHIDPMFLDGYDRPLDVIRKQIARRTLVAADSLRVVAKFIKDRIEKSLPLVKKFIYVLPVYIDKEKVKSFQASFDLHERYGLRFVVLMVARLTPQKNLPLALRVLKAVHASFPDTGLVVIGAGVDEEKLKSLAKRLGIEAQVVFAGWQEDLASYYKTSDVFMQTSKFE